MAPLTILEGYLLKRGQMTAKRRYFSLQHDEDNASTSTLTYWGSKEEMEGNVPARGQLLLGADGRLQDLAPTGRRGFTVTATAQRKAWSMASESNNAEEAQRWQIALTAVLLKAAAAAAAGLTAAAAVLEEKRTIPESGMGVGGGLSSMEEENESTSSSSGSSSSSDSRYTVQVSGQDFVLDKRYDDIRPLGHGAYGVVVSARDRTTSGEKVAIKKCPNVFEDPLDAKRIAREIRLLRHFHHPNIVKLTDLPLPPSYDFGDVYMVTEQMDTDLHRVIYSGQKLTEEHVQFFLYQLLCGLKHIHSANVIHRDLKPSNILLNENCDLKICDFGLARDMGADTAAAELPSNLTEYVVTRWYRAPEIMLSSQEYSKAIDVWASGCIFGEMLGRKPMFPGNDYIHQLKLITRTVGTPTSEADLWFVKNPKAKVFMLSLPPSLPQDLSKRFPDVSPDALDLMSKMLQLDYKKRISVDAALEHPFFSSVREQAMEYVCPTAVPWGDVEKCRLTRSNLQKVILEDVCTFHPAAQGYLNMHRAQAMMRAGGGGGSREGGREGGRERERARMMMVVAGGGGGVGGVEPVQQQQEQQQRELAPVTPAVVAAPMVMAVESSSASSSNSSSSSSRLSTVSNKGGKEEGEEGEGEDVRMASVVGLPAMGRSESEGEMEGGVQSPAVASMVVEQNA